MPSYVNMVIVSLFLQYFIMVTKSFSSVDDQQNDDQMTTDKLFSPFDSLLHYDIWSLFPCQKNVKRSRSFFVLLHVATCQC